jgi:hypothetical protein
MLGFKNYLNQSGKPFVKTGPFGARDFQFRERDGKKRGVMRCLFYSGCYSEQIKPGTLARRALFYHAMK